MRIFSGIRPSGTLHLGNYLGALRQWVSLQETAELMVVGVVDYHAVTTAFDPKTLTQRTLETVRDFIAAGIDPSRTLIIVQSWMPEHTEAAWLFAAATPLSWFEKVPTFKEKAADEKTVTLGLLSYPALMAADILLYRPTHVPVGEDQLPHLELTNEIVRRFNHHYGTHLEEVEAVLPTAGARVMSLQDPRKKMSKSGDDGIVLGDTPDAIREKIKKAVTDSGSTVVFDPKNKPAIANLLTTASVLSGRDPDTLAAEYSGKGYATFKEAVAEIIVEALRPIREKRAELEDDAMLIKILRDGTERARPIAGATLDELKQHLGFLDRREP